MENDPNNIDFLPSPSLPMLSFPEERRIYDYYNGYFWADDAWRIKRENLRNEPQPSSIDDRKPWTADFHGLSTLSIYPWIMLELEHYTLWSKDRLPVDCDYESVARDRYVFTMAALDRKWHDVCDGDRGDGPSSSEFFDAMHVFLMGVEHWFLPNSPRFAYLILLRISTLCYGNPRHCDERVRRHRRMPGHYPNLSIENPLPGDPQGFPMRVPNRTYHTLDDMDQLMMKIIAKRLDVEGSGTSWEYIPHFNTTVPPEVFNNQWRDDFMEKGGSLLSKEDMSLWCRLWEQERFIDTDLNKQISPFDAELQHWAIYEHGARRKNTGNWAEVGLHDLLCSRKFLRLFGLDKGFFPKSIEALHKITVNRWDYGLEMTPPFVFKYMPMY
ncbi:hypothetical protein E2P81_ATG07645 [Venturia nashicola]|nr:hypothetical protein E2P81_ATG07645 [Venturia nashicola]